MADLVSGRTCRAVVLLPGCNPVSILPAVRDEPRVPKPGGRPPFTWAPARQAPGAREPMLSTTHVHRAGENGRPGNAFPHAANPYERFVDDIGERMDLDIDPDFYEYPYAEEDLVRRTRLFGSTSVHHPEQLNNRQEL